MAAQDKSPISNLPGPNGELKHLAAEIFERTMASIDVRRAMLERLWTAAGRLCWGAERACEDGSIALGGPIHVVAVGKAAARMAAALDDILGGGVAAGLVVAPAVPTQPRPRFRYITGGHPYPNEGSVQGAEAALELMDSLGSGDIVVFLISGGGSALFEKPLDPAIHLAELAVFNKVLVTGGLPIEQMNTLRKHLSAVKGGRLAARAYPARQLTVFISDVPNGCDSMVASGPTFPDPSSAATCYELAARNNLASSFPTRIRARFEAQNLEETPKPGDERFARSQYFRLLASDDAVQAALAAVREAGLVAEVYHGPWDDDFREVARASAAALDDLTARHPGRAVCLAMGGEVNCRVTGPGVGGRNQAFALYAATLAAGRNRVVLSAGTDGRDGNSPAAGAVADGQTLGRAAAEGFDAEAYLEASDSYHLFKALGDTLEMGYTDNNVRDLRLWIDAGT